MLKGLTFKGDRVYWRATTNSPPNVRHKDIAAEVRRAFSDWADPVCELLSTTDGTAILHNDIVDRPPTRHWCQGRVALLGDAAHPTTPNLGQGGCNAIEDAVVLTRILQSTGCNRRVGDYRRTLATLFSRTYGVNYGTQTLRLSEL